MVDAALTPSIMLKGRLPDRAGYFALLGGLPHCGEECGGVLLRVPHRMDIDLEVRVGGVGRKVDGDVGLRRAGVERHRLDRGVEDRQDTGRVPLKSSTRTKSAIS